MYYLGCSNRGLSSTAKKAIGVLTLVVALLAATVPMFSQAAVGTILGGVFDSSGAVIAGAKVTITDQERGTARVLATDGSGEFNAPSLAAGTYTVRAEAKGFQTVDHSNVVLSIAGNVRVDLTLAPGEQTQTVTVTEEIPAIDATSSTLGGTVTNTSITQLPLISRNFLQLLQLRPGVVDQPGGSGNATVTNGRRQGADVLVIEGVTQFDLATSNVLINGANKGGGNTSLPLDSVQEFTTLQGAPAEYGWRDGSEINVGIKSGTNSLHGSAYAFGRNAQWTDARTWVPTGTGTLSNLTQVQPGFTLGGPAIKNKLFWFVSAEFVRQSLIDNSQQNAAMDVATGNVTQNTLSMVDACNFDKSKNLAINPLSAQLAGLDPTTCTVKPASSTFENIFPYNPTTSVATFPNPASENPSNNGLAKVDYSPNDKNHFSGFVFFSRQTSISGSKISPYWSTLGIGSTTEYAGAWTYTPNSNWVNDLRGGATPNTGNTVSNDQSVDTSAPWGLSSAGIPTGYGVTTGGNFGGFPCILISGLYATTGPGNCGKNGARGPQYQMDFSDKVSYLRGNHAFKFGYEEVFVHFEDNSLANTSGTLNFGSLAAFLNGNITSGNIAVGNNSDDWRERWHSAFAQDTWRVSKKLTITPGVRWEYVGSPHATDNRVGNFDPTVVGGVVQVGPGLPTSSLVKPSKANFNPRIGVAYDIFGNGKTVLRGGIGNLSSLPAITAIMGGNTQPYGATLCTQNAAAPCTSGIVVNKYGSPLQTAALVTSSTFTNSTGGATGTWNATTPIFSSAAAATATSGPSCTTSAPCSFLVVDPGLKAAKSLQWNVDLQRAITNNLTVDVAYVGTHGYNEPHTIDLNEAPLGAGWTTGVVTTCLAGLGQTTNPAGANYFSSAACSPSASAITAARPYASQFPYYQYIEQYTSGFHSNYSGLQLTVNGRNYHGLNFIGAYTWSHALDQWTKSSQATTALADPSNASTLYGNSDFDVRHRLRLSPSYNIPGIKSPAQLLQGWQLNVIWTIQSGFPFSATAQSSPAIDWAGNAEIANNIPSPNKGAWETWNYSGPVDALNGNKANPIPCFGQLSGCSSLASAPSSIQQGCLSAAQAPYSSAQQQQLAIAAMTGPKGACFTQNGGFLTPPAYGTLGNSGRNFFRNPMYQNWDFALAKMWHVKERYTTQFRMECYNCLNQVSYNLFSNNVSDPSNGGNQIGVAGFGYHTAVQAQMRQFQFGLKITF